MRPEDVDLHDTWGTSKAATRLGMSVKTLRYWDEKGWLKACGLTVIRTATGYRKFVPAEVERLALQIKRQEVKIVGSEVMFCSSEESEYGRV